VTQSFRRHWFLVALLTGACSGAAPTVVPSAPEEAVHGFMSAVQAGALSRMADLWGTDDGPASRRMDREELEMRVRVMRQYLIHESYEVLVGQQDQFSRNENLRYYQVRLVRGTCVDVVPFTLVRYGGGWLVQTIDLAQAGNPARVC
jgi:hypothetical protein